MGERSEDRTITVEGDYIVSRTRIPGLEAALIRTSKANPRLDTRELRQSIVDSEDERVGPGGAVDCAATDAKWGSTVWHLAWEKFNEECPDAIVTNKDEWDECVRELLQDKLDGCTTGFYLGRVYWEGLDNWRPAVEGRLAGSLFFARELLMDDGLWPDRGDETP